MRLGRWATITAPSSDTLERWRRVVVDTLVMAAVGLLGGFLFRLLGLPLPWTLGSLTGAALVAIYGGRWLMPAPVRDFARPVVGVLAGSSFTSAALLGVIASWDAILFVAVYAFATSALGWLFFRRLCRLDPVTAYFASTPGGLGEMSLLGGLLGGDMRALVLIHSIRIVVVVFTVPAFLHYALGYDITPGAVPAATVAASETWGWYILIACGVVGYIVGKLVRFPGGVMIAAMLASAVVHATGLTHLSPPGWLVALVQVLIGTIAGGRFAGVRWNELLEMVGKALGWAIVLVVTAIAAATFAAWLFDKPLPVFLLALAPGGMAEMMVISYALGIEASFVIICQVGRTFLVTTCTPIFCSLLGIADPKAATKPPAPQP